MSKLELISRSYLTEVRAAGEEEARIQGRPIVFGSQTDIGGWFGEVIEQGALDEADLSDVRFCKNHDTSNVYARFKRGKDNNTMNLAISRDGLDIDAGLDVKGNPLAATLYSEVKRGDISGMSFMFSVKEEEWKNLDTDYPIRHITKIGSVVEVSAVTFPAYEATQISARDEGAVEAARKALEDAKEQRNAAEAAEQEAEAERAAALELEKLKAEILYGGN